MRHECLRHAITPGRALIVLAERIDSVDELLARVRQYSWSAPVSLIFPTLSHRRGS